LYFIFVIRLLIVASDLESESATVATGRMKTNLAIRMGQKQKLKESLNFLERMRPLIGAKEFANKSIALMTCLPNPETYMQEVTSSFIVKSESVDEGEE
jgi:hypothetical protein